MSSAEPTPQRQSRAEKMAEGSQKPSGELSSALVGWVERRLGAGSYAAYRYPKRVLLAVVLLTAAAVTLAGHLRIDADLTQLLPDSFQSVQDIEVLKNRFGGVGYVVVVGLNAEPEALKRFARDVAPELEKLSSVRYVDYERPLGFFKDHALYYLDVEDLETVRDRLVERETWERNHRNPLYVDLEESDPPSLEFEELQEKYRRRGDQEWMTRQDTGGDETYYLDPDKRMVALFLKPSSIAADLAFATEFVGRVRDRLATVDLKQYGPDMRVELTGRYAKKVDQQELIQRDLAVASSLALALVLLYLGLHFRRVTAVGLIMIPLSIGLTWAYGYAAAAFEALNVLTAFIGAVLLGLGIDHGIHLLTRYEAETSAGASAKHAIVATFANTGRAVVVAALTTTVGFAGLALSEFRAFREFGVIAAVGMVFVVLSYTFCMPALLSLVSSWGWRPRRVDTHTVAPFARVVQRYALPLMILSNAVLVAGVVLMQYARFDYDFNSLEASDLPSMKLDVEVNRMLGYSQTPVVVLADDLEAERAVTAALRQRKSELGDGSTVDFVAASADFVPGEQAAKKPVIEEIGAVVEKVKASWLDADQRPFLKAIKRMVVAEPFTREGLPLAVRRQFLGPDGSTDKGFALVFPAVSLSDGRSITKLADEIRGARLPDGRRPAAAGEAMVLADILNMVTGEAPQVLGLTLAFIFATLLLLMGRFGTALVCLAPALATLVITMGLLPLVGMRLNYLNIVMIPVLFGIGVDGGAHIVTRLGQASALPEVLTETGRAISGAILTTGLGFGAMVIAHHRGLNSLGDLALLGLAVNLLACLIGLPTFLVWRSQRSRRSRRGGIGSADRGRDPDPGAEPNVG